ncbi:MAG: class II aldolase/adducin family protein [Chloroflexi bacterium]|nr:class II aldolase/adducin family protein [Chloroflexota bacterium]
MSPEPAAHQLQRLKDILVEGAAILYARGLNDGFGHLSARVPGTDSFLITPKRRLGDLRPWQMAHVDFLGNILEVGCGEGPPFERILHGAIYSLRPDVGAVARTQALACEAFVIAGRSVRVAHDFGATAGEETALFDNPHLIDNEEIALACARALGNRRAVLMRGNGNAVVGGDVMEAVVRAVFLEASARLQMAAGQLGEVGYLTREEFLAQEAEHSLIPHVERAWQGWLGEARDRGILRNWYDHRSYPR